MTLIIPQTEKRCTRCNEVKTASEFSKRYARSLVSWCKACHAEERRKRYDTDKAYVQHLQCTYGLSVEQYMEMYAAQGGRCAACRDRLELRTRSRVAVDHDHATGKIRGLLCNSCNSALGMLRDESRRVRSLLRYIQRFDAQPKTVCQPIVQLTWLAEPEK